MSVAPSALLGRLVEQRVAVRLKDLREIVGRLRGADEHLNLVLDDAQETTPERTRRLGRIVLRGSNVVSLAASPVAAPGRSA